MNKYTAVWGRGGRIMSTFAESAEEADAELERQLSRPGRWPVLKRWDEDGRQMIVDDGDRVVTVEGVANEF